jgi:hypothetical protein
MNSEYVLFNPGYLQMIDFHSGIDCQEFFIRLFRRPHPLCRKAPQAGLGSPLGDNA